MSDKFDFDQFEDDKEAMNFDSFEDSSQQTINFDDFEDDQEPIKSEPMSTGEAMMYGAQQGATFGFADELAGAMGAASEKMSEITGGQDIEGSDVMKMLTPEAQERAKKAGLDKETIYEAPESNLSDLYREYREGSRAKLKEAEEAAPLATMGADIASGLLTGGAAVKGATKVAQNVPKLKQLLDSFRGSSKVKQGLTVGAGVGAAETSGRSEEEAGTQEFMEDVLTGTGLGAVTGGIGGKVAKKMEAKNLRKAAGELEEDANRQAMKSLGAGQKEFAEELEAQYKFGRPKGTGEFALKEGLVDPLSRPDQTYKNVIKKKNNISKGYQKEINKFTDRINLSEAQAEKIADDAFRRMDETVSDRLRGSDTLLPEMRESLKTDMSLLQQEMTAALKGNNPIRDLQELYVRYNKDFFKNTTSPTAEARNVLRQEIKKLQRDLVDTIDSKSSKKFKQLDKSYMNLLDLEEMSKNAAAKSEAGSKMGMMSDLAKGATAKFIGLPVVGEAITGAGVASRKLLGKDITDVAAGASAIQKAKSAKQLRQLAGSKSDAKIISEGMKDVAKSKGPLDVAIKSADLLKQSGRIGTKKATEDVPEFARKAVTTGAAVVDDQESSRDYRKAMKSVSELTPESLANMAGKVRTQYGEKGETLAKEIEDMAEKDIHGRNATMYRLLTDPGYSKMLKGEKEEK